jgi:hypothetical protein
MNFSVHELPKARADKRSIFEWLFERSPQGARAWLAAYNDILQRLENQATSFGAALENEDCELDVKQAFFKTKRGRVYRVLFFVDNTDAYVLRVRRPGQAPVKLIDLLSSERPQRFHDLSVPQYPSRILPKSVPRPASRAAHLDKQAIADMLVLFFSNKPGHAARSQLFRSRQSEPLSVTSRNDFLPQEINDHYNQARSIDNLIAFHYII